MKVLFKTMLSTLALFFICFALNAQDIQKIEYFVDVDPGLGNAAPVTFTGGSGDFIEDIEIPIGDLDVGFHKVGIRAQDTDDTWGIFIKKAFYVFVGEPSEPAAVLTNVEYLIDEELGFGTGVTANLVATGNPSEYIVEIPTEMIDCGIHDIWISVKNADGVYATQKIAADINVFDDASPTIQVFSDIVAQLDANGQASITIDDVNDGTFDDCELASVALDQPQLDFTCENIGENTIAITAVDAEDKTSIQNVTVTVVDPINPVAIGQDIEVDLAGQSSVTITANDVDNGSSDNCNFTLSIDQDTFTEVGDYPVILTITDTDGNEDSVTVTVTVTESLSISEAEQIENAISLHPVPAKETVTIVCPFEIDQLSIYDITGKRVIKQHYSNSTIDISQLNSGVYFVKLLVKNTSVTKRLVKF